MTSAVPRLAPHPVHYPESLRRVGAHLSFLVGDERLRPGAFNDIAPVVVRQVVDLFESVHAMHDRAVGVLDEHARRGRPYALYLRAFASGGVHGEVTAVGAAARQTLMIGQADARLRRHLEANLAGLLPVVSCFNTLDFHSTQDAADPARAPAVLRLLSHNWQSQIGSLIDGAQLVVLLLNGGAQRDGGQGVQFEMSALHALGQTGRCIFLVDTPQEDGPLAGFGVHATFGWALAHADWSQAAGPRAFADCVRALAADGHRRRRRHPPLATPPCFVVDKGYDAAQFASGELREADYPNLVPETWWSNAQALQRDFPPVWRFWRDVEQRVSANAEVSQGDFQAALFDLLNCFVMAVTLEDYDTMARTLVSAGAAHRLLAWSNEFARVCADGALKFARRAGRADLVARYGAVLAQLAEDLPPRPAD